MVDSFRDFISETKGAVKTEDEPVSGAYDCQSCDAYVRDGFYNRKTKTLYWVCTNGHRSEIKDFM